jgi:hypothetical protein
MTTLVSLLNSFSLSTQTWFQDAIAYITVDNKPSNIDHGIESSRIPS